MAVTAETFQLLRSQQDAINATIAKLDGRIQKVWYSIRSDLDANSWYKLTPKQRRNLADALSSQWGARLESIAVDTKRTARELADQAWQHQKELAESQLPFGVEFRRPDPGAVEAIHRRTERQIESRLRPLNANAQEAMYSNLRRGVAEGANPREIARAAVNLTTSMGAIFDGGTARALNIARTEALDAYRTSGQLTQQANPDVLEGWVWVAKLTARTCRSCWSKHGTVHPIEEPGPLDHPQGRCARVPKTKPWSELGFDGIEEDDSNLLDANREFNRLTEDQQRQVLGDAGFDAWKAGKYSRRSWSVQENPADWRPFYRASKPPTVSPRPSVVSPAPSRPPKAMTPAPARAKGWKARHQAARDRYDRLDFNVNQTRADLYYNRLNNTYTASVTPEGELNAAYKQNLDAVMDAGTEVEKEWYGRVAKKLGAPPQALLDDLKIEADTIQARALQAEKDFDWTTKTIKEIDAFDAKMFKMREPMRQAYRDRMLAENQRADAMAKWLQENPRKNSNQWRAMANKLEGDELKAVLNELDLELGSNELSWFAFGTNADKTRLPELMKAAERLYPKSWVLRAKAKNRIVQLKKTARGYNAEGGAEIALSDTGTVGRGIGDVNHVAVHELGHSMETAVPGLAQMEWAFLHRRASIFGMGRRVFPKTTSIYGTRSEMAWKDEFKEHYTGKLYGGGNWEVFTTGIESLWAGSGYLDREFRRWLLGVLTVL